MKSEKSKKTPLLVISIIVIAGLAVAAYLWFSQEAINTNQTNNTTKTSQSSVSNQPTSLTNDQIFQEVSSELGITRDVLAYFRIWGQDKVQYNTGPGTTYAYKISGTWKIAQKDAQSIAKCNDLEDVPVEYRPGCDNKGTQQYVNEDGTSLNYPLSSMVSYIGE